MCVYFYCTYILTELSLALQETGDGSHSHKVHEKNARSLMGRISSKYPRKWIIMHILLSKRCGRYDMWIIYHLW